jgi:hypothetical protein
VHWEVHIALRPGGKWAGDNAGPETVEEIARVESYMGLFERLNILHRNGVLPLDYIRQFYGYRLENIWANRAIREGKNLENAPAAWADFLELSQKLGKARETASYPTARASSAVPDTQREAATRPLPRRDTR